MRPPSRPFRDGSRDRAGEGAAKLPASILLQRDPFISAPAFRQASPGSRIAALDAVRAIFVLLGVIYHAALPYRSNDWVITDPDSARGLMWLAFGLRQFRMPGFFMISGFLAVAMYQKYGATDFFQRRSVRLGVPLLFGLLLINVPQWWLVAWLQRTQCLANDPACGVHSIHLPAVAHLWFLVYALIFVATVPAAVGVLRSIRGLAARMRPVHALACGLLLVILFGIGMHGVAHFVPALYGEVGGLLVPYDVLRMFGWFALGAICGVSPQFADAWFRDLPPRSVALASILIGLLLCVMVANFTAATGSLLNIAAESTATLGTGIMLFGVLQVLGGLYEVSPVLFAEVSEASYTIYLVHHPIVIGLAGSMLALRIGPYAKFGFIVVVASTVSYYFHVLVVRRVSWLRFVLNGTRD